MYSWVRPARCLQPKTLIPNISRWLEVKHGSSSYPLAQFLTGHGSFMSYRFKIGRVPFSLCLLYSTYQNASASVDDPSHTYEQCPAHADLRSSLAVTLNIPSPLTATSIAAELYTDREAWKAILEFTSKIIQRKDRAISTFSSSLHQLSE